MSTVRDCKRSNCCSVISHQIAGQDRKQLNPLIAALSITLHSLSKRVQHSVMLMSLYQLQDHPNYKDDIVNPKRNENNEVRPLYSLFQPQTQEDKESDCDEPGEQCSLNESHDNLSLFHLFSHSKTKKTFSAQLFRIPI